MTGDRPAGEVAQELWQRLRAEPWPLPLEVLPPGTALVGGAVRDGLLGRLEAQPDLDLVVAGDAIGLTRQLARSHGGSAVVLDADHGIARLVMGGWTIDLARRDGDSLEADLGRRDYTVNAIALPLPSASLDSWRWSCDRSAARLCTIRATRCVADTRRMGSGADDG